jgi:NADH-quinone oxidoreductase subunit L
MNLPLIILSAPLIAAVLIHFLALRKSGLALFIAIVGCLVSLGGALTLFFAPKGITFESLEWIRVGDIAFRIGFVTDELARLMLIVVTGIGLLVNIFSNEYLHGDKSLSRYYAKLSLFMFSMLGIVLADNLVMMFVFWELVGLSSYLLIGFWLEKPEAAEASKKAFLVNRVGDFGFMLGILGVWSVFGSVYFADLKQTIEATGTQGISILTIGLITFGLFCGCLGKSAQFPLHVWLPDAMEGPTPVSAFIHAATMVAAGVYMLCRVFFILELSPPTLTLIAYIGGFTAFFAAVIATQQDDIKRILAYSTLSQLGYMVMAVGLSATGAAMFHLTTHACFKALLFLGAGSVIYGLHHEQNIWNMGGLNLNMKKTFTTFLIATLALTGLPLTSGFFSKEAILLVAYQQNKLLFVTALLTAGFTSFYMFRLIFVVFTGRERSVAATNASESPGSMTWPLTILALFSLGAGFFPIQQYLGHEPIEGEGHYLVMALAFGVFVGGFLLARKFYAHAEKEVFHWKLLENKFYFDEFYQKYLVNVQQAWAQALDWFDRWILSGIFIRLTSSTANLSGEVLRLVQTGSLQFYAAIFALGVALMLWLLL